MMNTNVLPDEEALAAILSLGLSSLALVLSLQQQQQLLAYLTLLVKWNAVYNLTAIREPARMVTHHLLDSLAVLPFLPNTNDLHLLDVGTGAGLPAIPLAIARPDWCIYALDSSHKKTSFVQQAASMLELRQLTVMNDRVELYAQKNPGYFDGIISRAFADLTDFVTLTAPLLKSHGRFYAMKGLYPYEEIAALPSFVQLTAVQALRVPSLDAERHLVVITPNA